MRSLALGLLSLVAFAHSQEVVAPPASLKVSSFYTKYVDAHGFPIIASSNVNDYALKEAANLVDLLLAKRPDIKKAMVDSGTRLCVIAWNEFTTDLPEFAWLAKEKDPSFPELSGKEFWDARARGTGGSETDPYCSCAEENVLGYPGDPYAAECILIHEFAHSIHLRGLNRIDPTFDKRLKAAYDDAMKKGLWKGKYASTNHAEYFAEGVQSWFDNNRENDSSHNWVNTRAELQEYDPGLAALCKEVFGDTELRYTKPATRLTGHLAGYDPAKAPTFVWPDRLAKAREAIKRGAENRSKQAELSYAEKSVEGWTLKIDSRLAQPEVDAALAILESQLKLIERAVPKVALEDLRKVTLWFSPEYPGIQPRAEYHPGADWLKENGRNPAMAKGIEFTNLRIFEAENKRMPVFVLHELAHAYHDRVLGWSNPEILAAYQAAVKSGKYDKVKRRRGDDKPETEERAYALTNAQEYFAEGTEAFFGQNDFFPFTRMELRAHDPDLFNLLMRLWTKRKP